MACSLPVAIDDLNDYISGKHGAASAFLYRTISETIKLIWYLAHIGFYIVERKGVLPQSIRDSILEDIKNPWTAIKKMEVIIN